MIKQNRKYQTMNFSSSFSPGSSGNRGVLLPLRNASTNQLGFIPIQTLGILVWHRGESESHLREGCCPEYQHQRRRQPCCHETHTHYHYTARTLFNHSHSPFFITSSLPIPVLSAQGPLHPVAVALKNTLAPSIPRP